MGDRVAVSDKYEACSLSHGVLHVAHLLHLRVAVGLHLVVSGYIHGRQTRKHIHLVCVLVVAHIFWDPDFERESGGESERDEKESIHSEVVIIYYIRPVYIVKVGS